MDSKILSYQTIKFLKRTIIVFILILISIYSSIHFLAYKIEQESKYINELNHYVATSKDLHTLCMLDYMINPNGKDMLEQCKRINLQVRGENEKSLTPYYDFYKKYLQRFLSNNP